MIRTIEYWDIERKRYPQYEHCAVIIAEDITSRFLNVIQLFNGSRNNRYGINFSKNEIKEKRDAIKQLLELSYKKWT